MTVHRSGLVLGAILLAGTLVLASPPEVSQAQAATAVIHGQDIYLLTDSGVRQVTHDRRSKFSLHWSPNGKRLAYMQDDNPGRSLPTLKVIDLSGKPLASIPLFPGRPPWATSGGITPGTIGIDRWLDETRLALEGNLSRWVCMLMVADSRTGKMFHDFDRMGQCGSFEFSPDLHHILAQVNGRSNAEQNWFDSLSIDRREIFPKRGEPLIRFLTDPHWSRDGTTVSFLARDVASGRESVVIARPSGEVKRAWGSPALVREYEEASKPAAAGMPAYCAREGCTEVVVRP